MCNYARVFPRTLQPHFAPSTAAACAPAADHHKTVFNGQQRPIAAKSSALGDVSALQYVDTRYHQGRHTKYHVNLNQDALVRQFGVSAASARVSARSQTTRVCAQFCMALS